MGRPKKIQEPVVQEQPKKKKSSETAKETKDSLGEEKATLISVQVKMMSFVGGVELANSKPYSFYTGKTVEQATKELEKELFAKGGVRKSLL